MTLQTAYGASGAVTNAMVEHSPASRLARYWRPFPAISGVRGTDFLPAAISPSLSLLLRTGLRRSELTSLRVASLGLAQGHHVLAITGKGNVMRTVKVPPDVSRMIEEWLEAAKGAGVELDRRRPALR